MFFQRVLNETRHLFANGEPHGASDEGHVSGAGERGMIRTFAAAADYRFRNSGTFYCLFKPLFIRLCIDKLERINGNYFGIQFFVSAAIEQHRKALARANAEVVTTLGTDL